MLESKQSRFLICHILANKFAEIKIIDKNMENENGDWTFSTTAISINLVSVSFA